MKADARADNFVKCEMFTIVDSMDMYVMRYGSKHEHFMRPEK